MGTISKNNRRFRVSACGRSFRRSAAGKETVPAFPLGRQSTSVRETTSFHRYWMGNYHHPEAMSSPNFPAPHNQIVAGWKDDSGNDLQ
jgi:hypothetical protein